MSITSESLHDIVDTLSLIRTQFDNGIFWQKYVEGINLTFVDCQSGLCVPPVPANKFRVAGYVKHIEFVRTESDDTVYYSSLIVPIFQLLARRVGGNLSGELLISRHATHDIEQVYGIEIGKITAVDRVPYMYEFDRNLPGMHCAPPLYLINQLRILSGKVPVWQNSMLSMLTVFSLEIWLTIFVLYLVCCSLEYIVVMRRRKRDPNPKPETSSPLISIFINYFKALLAKEADDRRFTRSLYIAWIIGCVPLVEIFRNDIIAKIVENKFLRINSIEDLLGTRWEIYATANDVQMFEYYNEINNATTGFERKTYLRNKRLLDRTTKMKFDDTRWLDLFNDPRKMMAAFRKTAILEDEFAIQFFLPQFCAKFYRFN